MPESTEAASVARCRGSEERHWRDCHRPADPDNDGGWCCDNCYMRNLKERGVQPFASWPDHDARCEENQR